MGERQDTKTAARVNLRFNENKAIKEFSVHLSARISEIVKDKVRKCLLNFQPLL